MSHTTQAIADYVDGRLLGPGDLALGSLAEIDLAQQGQLTFIGTAKYAHKWADSKASAALVGSDIELEPGDGRALIVVDNADLAMAKVLAMYAPPKPRPPKGVHPSALVAETATIGEGCRIGPNCVIKPGVTIGKNTTLHAGAILFDNARVGDDCEIWANVVVRDHCTIGDRCILHPGAVIGADGFGFRADTTGPAPKLIKVPQIGVVRIGNDCEIGANSAIDRAKFDATVLGDHCKLDNLVQIGHNCRLGNMVVISGCVGIGGSCTIGDGTLIGGKAMLKDHVHVGRGCQIAGGAAVINDIPDGEAWGGYPAAPLKEKIREELAIKKLPDMMKQVRKVLKDL
ncbi:MAG: UDP-3-O-(3-hydroxymyristoyl)glucosamine N-acyltransferase [Phycisphaeraceae bacterium]